MSGTADDPPSRHGAERTGEIGPWTGRRRTVEAHGTPASNTSPSDSSSKRPVGLVVTGNAQNRSLRPELDRFYDVIVVSDLAAAAAVLGDTCLDFVLVDTALAEQDMMELITYIRVDQWLRSTAVICYADAPADLPTSRMAALAAHDLITGPVTDEQLIARIERQLSRARLRRAN